MTCRIETVTAQPALVTVAGEVDMASSQNLETALREPVEQGHDVVLDMREVAFIDCTGLRAILAGASLASRRGRVLVLRPSAAVARLIRLTRHLEPSGLRWIPDAGGTTVPHTSST